MPVDEEERNDPLYFVTFGGEEFTTVKYTEEEIYEWLQDLYKREITTKKFVSTMKSFFKKPFPLETAETIKEFFEYCHTLPGSKLKYYNGVIYVDFKSKGYHHPVMVFAQTQCLMKDIAGTVSMERDYGISNYEEDHGKTNKEIYDNPKFRLKKHYG
jgi:hypothetical protein